jgi:hypothetical protein
VIATIKPGEAFPASIARLDFRQPATPVAIAARTVSGLQIKWQTYMIALYC